MIAQWRLGAMDRMRLIDRPEEVFLSPYLIISMRQLYAIQSILAKALLKARESHQGVRSIRVALGEIAEIDTASIQNQWDELSKGTPVERAPLHFRFIKAEVQCMACFQKYHPSDGKIHCPYCGSYGAKVLAGEEFYLESIEVDNEQD